MEPWTRAKLSRSGGVRNGRNSFLYENNSPEPTISRERAEKAAGDASNSLEVIRFNEWCFEVYNARRNRIHTLAEVAPTVIFFPRRLRAIVRRWRHLHWQPRGCDALHY